MRKDDPAALPEEAVATAESTSSSVKTCVLTSNDLTMYTMVAPFVTNDTRLRHKKIRMTDIILDRWLSLAAPPTLKIFGFVVVVESQQKFLLWMLVKYMVLFFSRLTNWLILMFLYFLLVDQLLAEALEEFDWQMPFYFEAILSKTWQFFSVKCCSLRFPLSLSSLPSLSLSYTRTHTHALSMSKTT